MKYGTKTSCPIFSVWRLVLGGLMLFLVVVPMTGCIDSRNDTSIPSTIQQEWYKGGNLHRASIADWKNATYENKLATVADFVASTQKGKSTIEKGDIDGYKTMSIELVTCIDGATKNSAASDSASVSWMAAVCVEFMGWGK